MPRKWTKADDALILGLASEGKTGAEIAAAMGLTSRGMVLGRLNRLRKGLPGRKPGRLYAYLDEIKSRYAAGESLNSIARSFSAYHGYVAETLKRAGVVLRPRYLRVSRVRPPKQPRLKAPVAPSPVLTADQAERIHHREVIIDNLTRAVRGSSDPVFVKRAQWIIDDKKADIDRILAQSVAP